MNKRKKRDFEQRKKERQLKIKELRELQDKAFQLEKELELRKSERIKELNIRNLKIFMNTCNFLAPFVLTAGLTVGGIKLFGLGLPIHTDKIINYKVYSLEYQTGGIVSMDEEYKTNRWFDDELPANKLTIYTPWELEDNRYFRYKLNYTLGKLENLDLFNALLTEDYFYIKSNIGDNIKYGSQERQETENVQDVENSEYYFKANLTVLDEEDTLVYDETNLKNILVSISELLITGGIGVFCTRFRKFKYTDEIRKINNGYKEKINDIQVLEHELESTNKKILALQRKGVRPNVK